ncbi:hypothetical protein NPIL_207991 [Nephila pilipes]|uniref:Uncharacterized protein n=1 Tax=Nephila pilipes TaxID=299642 RepID=A0A8X6N109_NEPPI|nr:hypothetical protein NPIL_207991 [Nephila pilipes]
MMLLRVLIVLSVIYLASAQSTEATPAESFNLKSGAISKNVDNPILQAILQSPETQTENPEKNPHRMKRYPVASFDFDHIATPFIITAWIFVACCAKIELKITVYSQVGRTHELFNALHRMSEKSEDMKRILGSLSPFE